jgi:phosphoglycerate kinase
VAVEKWHATYKMSYISTGGGAFIEMLEGKTLPAIKALELAE